MADPAQKSSPDDFVKYFGEAGKRRFRGASPGAAPGVNRDVRTAQKKLEAAYGKPGAIPDNEKNRRFFNNMASLTGV